MKKEKTKPVNPLLKLAGRMADVALNLVGGPGLNFTQRAATVHDISELAAQLRKTVLAYNNAVLRRALKSPKELTAKDCQCCACGNVHVPLFAED